MLSLALPPISSSSFSLGHICFARQSLIFSADFTISNKNASDLSTLQHIPSPLGNPYLFRERHSSLSKTKGCWTSPPQNICFIQNICFLGISVSKRHSSLSAKGCWTSLTQHIVQSHASGLTYKTNIHFIFSRRCK